jgi:hypothetical protein
LFLSAAVLLCPLAASRAAEEPYRRRPLLLLPALPKVPIVKPTAPACLRCAALLSAVWAVAASPASAADPASSRDVVAAVQPFVDRHVVAGAVMLVADGDKVLSLDAVGFADVAGRKPMATDALFWIAS